MQCPKCQAEAPEGARFCPMCGKRLPKPKPEYPKIAEELEIRQVDPVLTAKEVAKLLRVSEWMIYELVRQNKIPYFTIGTRKRFRAKDILEWAGTLDGPVTTAG
ncbi:helix-turn-helix domain-containing protein [Desulfovirgula thermocuniculi]|uniref:helix-turn-helix domain-containing protein n=1 Tax=Desulfovirgula thermocuniculi TaxID=348842 RepID=UPI000428A1D5|nr:helix-turn-helix domain-containing protein [Desulfovirgula thermocuniculi]